MAYIFIDESGDLGFNFKKKCTSRYFVVTAVKVHDSDKKSFEKIIKKIYAHITPRYHLSGILHATEEREATRQKLFKRLKDINCEITYAVVDKRRVSKDWMNNENLYERMLQAIIKKVSQFMLDSGYQATYVLSRRESNKNKNALLKSNLVLHASMMPQKIRIEIKKPAEEKGLQIVDFISWAIFAGLNGDDSYLRLIKDKIVCVITDSH